jgi:hypothetical protein
MRTVTLIVFALLSVAARAETEQINCQAVIQAPYYMVWHKTEEPRCRWLSKSKPKRKEIPHGATLYWCTVGKDPCQVVTPG